MDTQPSGYHSNWRPPVLQLNPIRYMNIKNITVLLSSITLYALLCSLCALLLPLQKKQSDNNTLTPGTDPLFSCTAAQLDSIAVYNGNSSFALLNYGTHFSLQGHEEFLLSSARMNSLLQLFTSFPCGQHETMDSPDSAEETRWVLSLCDGTQLSFSYYTYPNHSDLLLLTFMDQNYLYSRSDLSPLLNCTSVEQIGSLKILPSFLETETADSFFTLQSERETLSFLFSSHDSIVYLLSSSPHPLCSEKQAYFSVLSSFQADSIAVAFPTESDILYCQLKIPSWILNSSLFSQSFSLAFSSVQKDGTVYVQKDRQGPIYCCSVENCPFLSLCSKSILDESLFLPDYDDCTQLQVTTGEDQTWFFTKWDGHVLCNGIPIEAASFSDLCSSMKQLIPCGVPLFPSDNSEPILSLLFFYTNPQQSKDQLLFYPNAKDPQHYLFSLNDSPLYLIEAKTVEKWLSPCLSLPG